MSNRFALAVCASIAALACLRADAGRAAEAERTGSTAWVPALAALGDTYARSDQRAAREEGAVLVVPVLVAVGADAGSVGAAGVDPAPAVVETPDETQRWVPGFAFVSGMLGQQAEGTVRSDSTLTYTYFAQDSGIVISHTRPGPRQPAPGIDPVLVPLTTVITRSLAEGKGERFVFRNNTNDSLIIGVLPALEQVLPTSGSDLFLTPSVGASLELMTPGLQSVPLKPRLFVHGDASLAFSFTRAVAKEGVPEGAEIPDPVPPVYNEIQVKGVGSKTEGEVKTLLFSGGVGGALTLHLWERPFRIKPSFDFVRQEVEVGGRLIRAFRKDTGLRQAPLRGLPFLPAPPPGSGLPTAPVIFTTAAPAAFIPIDLEARDTKTYYGIGPGLELEMDAARAGPVMLTVFVSGQAYKMLGDLDVKLQATQQISDPALVPDNQTVSADFDYSMHSWAYRGSVGLRFRWLPED